MILAELLDTLDGVDDSYIITTENPNWSENSEVELHWVDEFSDPETREPIAGYLLEVFLAKEVLEVWSEWRGGRVPTKKEKCEAIIYYAKNDSYIPVTIRP